MNYKCRSLSNCGTHETVVGNLWLLGVGGCIQRLNAWSAREGTTVLFYGIQGDTGAIDVSVDLLLFLFLFQLTIVRQFLASSVRIKTTTMLC